MSSPDAVHGEPAPTDANSVDVFHYSPPCSDAGSSCGRAKLCVQDILFGLDTGDISPGVHPFVQEQDAAAYARSLGFQGALTGDYVEFTSGGDPYVFAQLDAQTFAVVDGAIAPDVYAGIVRYEQCTYPEDGSTDADDGPAE